MEKSKKSEKIVSFLFITILLGILCSCSNTRKNIPNAHTVYEAYRYLGDDSISIDERKKKIMRMLYDCHFDEVTSGITFERWQDPEDDNYFTKSYIAFGNNIEFKNGDFITSNNNHVGIAYIANECEYGIMEDSLKILFPDSINARKFFNEAIELGFKRNKTYIPEGCSSLNDCAEYIDDHCIMVIRILSKKNNCVVVLHRLI